MNIIITGGHSGIGLELSKLLLQEGHHLGLIVRSEKRKQDALNILGQDKKIDFFFADLRNQLDIKRVSTDISSKWKNIDGLFNNAGVLTDQAYYSPQGNELQFEVNALAPYLLTKSLQPLLEKSDRSFVINTSTDRMFAEKSIDIPDLKKPKKFVKLLGAYLKSKFASVVLTNYLAKETPNIRMLCVNPGPNKTNMTKGSGMPSWLLPFRNIMFAKPIKGAKLLYQGAFDEKFTSQTGIYITNGKIKPIQYTVSKTEVENMLGVN